MNSVVMNLTHSPKIIYSSSRRQGVAKARTERAEEHARSRIGDSRDGASAGLRAR